MSYLDSPRVHFFGDFIAEPSTNNNIAGNFAGPIQDPGWNPNGNHKFAFSNCKICAVVDHGQVITTNNPLLGAQVSNPGVPFAKLVDLDVEVQMASKVYGLVVSFSDTAGNSVSGKMMSASFRDFSGARLLGVYQSKLTDLQWTVTAGSWLAKLQKASPKVLSIRFITDLYTGMSGGAHRGRIAGAIGPARNSDTAHYVAGRRLVGVQGPSALATLHGDTLTIDAGNVVPVDVSLGFKYPSLIVAVKGRPNEALDLKSGAETFGPTTLPTGWQRLGDIPTTLDRYKVTGGVESLTLSASQVAVAGSHNLGLFTPAGAALAMEASDGLFIFPDQQTYAMNPGEQVPVTFTATRFGKPAAGVSIALVRTTNAAAAGITLPPAITTDADGKATATFSASDPGSPRQPIDGQVFGVSGPWANHSGISIPGAGGAIAIVVRSGFTVPKHPKWADIKPIFAMYSRMYPSMTAILNLSDLNAVIAGKNEIRARMLLSPEDAGYMPVSRDLSAKKKKMIISWIDAGCPQ